MQSRGFLAVLLSGCTFAWACADGEILDGADLTEQEGEGERAFPGMVGDLERAVIEGPGGPMEVEYEAFEGRAIFEGDIELNVGEPTLRSLGSKKEMLWKDGIVPYAFHKKLGQSSRRDITTAMETWNRLTGIRFVARTDERDYVEFVTGKGCDSLVGRQGGRQIIHAAYCKAGGAMHEIGHALGLWHEQSRPDRDEYVEIHRGRISPRGRHNFNKVNGLVVGAYDYGSIMHYRPNEWSWTGRPTITPRRPLSPGVVMGQRKAPSSGDIATILALYDLTAPSPDQGPGPNPDPKPNPNGECGGLDYKGRCADSVVEWCESGKLKRYECAKLGKGCGWFNDREGFDCVDKRCVDLNYTGRCSGATAEWCKDGVFKRKDCAAAGKSCVLTESDGYYCE